MLFPLAQWLPDLPPLNNPGASVATNVIPGPNNSYMPFPGMVVAASFSAIGSVSTFFYARDSANNTYTYAGDTSALYVQAGTTFTVASGTSAPYTLAGSDSWEFVSWGETVIAIDGHADRPQQISLGAANFVSIAGAPKARHIAVVKDFVVLGNVSDSLTTVQRVRWSGINNSAAWSADATTLADFQDLAGNGGWVQKIISGEQGYIFQERAIWRMTFVGSPLIFQFDKIHDGIGAYAAQAVVSYENSVYFLAADGFKMFDGSNITPIGEGRVDKTFIADLDKNFVYKVKAILYDQLKVVMWSYPGVGNTNGKANHIIIYSYAYDRWARVDIPATFVGGVDSIAIASTPGYTLETLDQVTTDIDALPFSLDDRVWTGGNLTFAAFIAGTMYYFTGTPMNAEVETSESNIMLAMEGSINHLAQIEEVWPVVDGLSATVAITLKTRNVRTEGLTVDGPTSPNDTGFCEFHNTARYHRFNIQTTGSFDSIQGVDVTAEDAGQR